MSMSLRVATRAALFILIASSSGCLVAAAAGAGGAIVLSGHTAEAIVDRSVSEMADIAQEVMAAEGVDITDTRSEDSGTRRRFEGRKGELDITVTIQETDEGTKVGVEAQRSAAQWDDDYARLLLARIIG